MKRPGGGRLPQYAAIRMSSFFFCFNRFDRCNLEVAIGFVSVVGVASIVTCTLWMFFEKFEYIADMLY